MASDHNEVKIEIDNKEIWDTHKYVKLNNILPNNQWVKKEIYLCRERYWSQIQILCVCVCV